MCGLVGGADKLWGSHAAACSCVSSGAAPVGLPRQQRWPVEQRRQTAGLLHECWHSAVMLWPAGLTAVSQGLHGL